MFLRSLTRTDAARYSMYAVAPLVLGIGAAAWVTQSEPVNHDDRVTEATKPYDPPAPAAGEVKTDPDPKSERPEIDSAAIAARFNSIKNHPVRIEPEMIPETQPIEPQPTQPVGDIKYVGPVRLGPVMLAILSVEGKQQSVSKGKTISYTLESVSHSAKVVGITETEVTLDENGTERVIARADSSGEVVSYVGGRPARSKPVTLKKTSGSSKGGAEHPLDAKASAEYQNKRAVAMERFAPMLERIAKEKNPAVASQLRDKIMASIKAEGLDPSVVDDELSKMKETGGNH